MEVTDIFDVIKVLGKGAAGTVLKVEKKSDGVIYALKLYDQEKFEDRLQEEFNAVKHITRKGCVPYLACYHELYPLLYYDDDEYMGLLIDFVDGYPLSDVVDILAENQEYLDESDLKNIMDYLAKALAYIHENGVAHRDIKSENIMISKSGQIVLIDFDLFCGYDKDCDGYVGTLDFMAPEVAKGSLYRSKTPAMSLEQWKMADVWSLGVVFYELANLSLPFTSYNDEDAREAKLKIINASLSGDKYKKSPLPKGKLGSLIEKMLTYVPTQRIKIKDLENQLNAYKIDSKPWVMPKRK